ncbi:uncharacterized protein UMAG_06453 [Mycosarcoma maydis]|uniref:Transaldolase n=1 Tax=Mycosarcoma maydis TaxID=5270 RepID=A0A0D1DT58_MYCMD|nr:uncharacterized protein UMAG_06453 [Ustilago maydis 521]KIS65750.1 hypothetical protein UMAG_06453 [Ustilago maydis 521]|eukprot:XP_011392722.1 hypothetical protein UMAG_06453 [Ustilago maydis 521]
MTASTVPIIVNAASQLEIDVDTLDVALTQQLASVGVQPNDMTSNQFIVADALRLAQNEALLDDVVRGSGAGDWLAILDRVSVRLCAQNLANISGRALLQVSPTHAYDTEQIVEHALAYDREFSALGIGKHRYCIKILATPAGVKAAWILESQHAIRTLATGVFSVAQALAAAQAGCLYISPYYNEILAHFTAPDERAVYDDPVSQHPMSPRMAHIYQAYRELTLANPAARPPVIKSASFIGINEVLAMPQLGAQQATILAPILSEMIQRTGMRATTKPYRPSKTYDVALPDSTLALLKIDRLRADGVAQQFDLSVDYLSHNAQQLALAISNDPETQRRLNDAIRVFETAQLNAKTVIDAAIARVNAAHS